MTNLAQPGKSRDIGKASLAYLAHQRLHIAELFENLIYIPHLHSTASRDATASSISPCVISPIESAGLLTTGSLRTSAG